MFIFAEGFNSIILYMGFISKLFSKKNKDSQKTSNDSPRESDVLSVSDKDALDYSNLSFDCNGWLTYPDGLKIRNVSSVLESFNDEEKVFEIMDETLREFLLRIVEYLLRSPVLVDDPLIHVEHPVGY